MSLTDHQKRYMKKRRAAMRAAGICPDCQQRPAKAGLNLSGKPFVCCETCLQARRDRSQAAAMPPLFRAIQRSAKETVH